MKIKKLITKSKFIEIIIFLAVSSISLFAYYYAITMHVSFAIFLKANSPAFIILQIVLSIANSLLMAYAIVLMYRLFTIYSQISGKSVINTGFSLIFSVATTGCYVCGNILFPSLGLLGAFASMPFGGLEIKVITLLLIAYSIVDLKKKINMGCKTSNNSKYIVLKYYDKQFKLRMFELRSLMPLIITCVLLIVSINLSKISPIEIKPMVNYSDSQMCTQNK
jgi:hypothetical protein